MPSDNLTYARVDINEFAPHGITVRLSFQADGAMPGKPDLASTIEIKLDQHKED